MPSIAHKSSTSRAVVGAQSTNVIVTLLCIARLLDYTVLDLTGGIFSYHLYY